MVDIVSSSSKVSEHAENIQLRVVLFVCRLVGFEQSYTEVNQSVTISCDVENFVVLNTNKPARLVKVVCGGFGYTNVFVLLF